MFRIDTGRRGDSDPHDMLAGPRIALDGSLPALRPPCARVGSAATIRASEPGQSGRIMTGCAAKVATATSGGCQHRPPIKTKTLH